MTILLAEVVALTIDFIPFTRRYRPGHAKLKTRWPLYLLGVVVFAFWPARLELSMVGQDAALLRIVAALLVGIAAVDTLGRRRAARWPVESQDEPEDELSGISVLDISFPARRTSEP